MKERVETKIQTERDRWTERQRGDMRRRIYEGERERERELNLVLLLLPSMLALHNDTAPAV